MKYAVIGGVALIVYMLATRANAAESAGGDHRLQGAFSGEWWERLEGFTPQNAGYY